jgi:hypothetical protein
MPVQSKVHPSSARLTVKSPIETNTYHQSLNFKYYSCCKAGRPKTSKSPIEISDHRLLDLSSFFAPPTWNSRNKKHQIAARLLFSFPVKLFPFALGSRTLFHSSLMSKSRSLSATHTHPQHVRVMKSSPRKSKVYQVVS